MTLSSNGIIGKANEAVEKTNIRQIESLATMLWAEAYANKAQDLKAAVEDGLKKNGITADKYAGYRLEVSANGVGFVKLNGDVTPPTDNPTASDDQPGNNNPGDNGSTEGNNIIPAGGRYCINIASGEYTYLEAGDEFPSTMKYRRYIYIW